MEMCSIYYTPGFITPSIHYNADECQLWNNYLVAVVDLLAWPHACALMFRGGLISWLVQALAPKEFFNGLLYGYSAQVTQYNKGFTNPEVGTVEDEVSQYDVSIILGVTTMPPGKGMNGTWSIWPSGRLFKEEFRGWDGEWNAACDDGLWTVGAKGKVGHLLAWVTSGSTTWGELLWKVYLNKWRKLHQKLGVLLWKGSKQIWLKSAQPTTTVCQIFSYPLSSMFAI